MKKAVAVLLFFAAVFPCLGSDINASSYSAIAESINAYVDTLDARIGFAVIAEEGAFTRNVSQKFPMLSVVKFPLALAVANKARFDNKSFDSLVPVKSSQLHTNTYSPMLKEYPAGSDYDVSIIRLLDYALRYSDNNACDILIDYVGGIDSLNSLLKK